MKEERIFILTMVNEGKITAAEGVELLNALAASESSIDIDGFVNGVKGKTADFADKAKPKVKKAARDIRDKSVEVFGNIKDKINDKFGASESAAAKDEDDIIDDESGEYVDITAAVDSDYTERTQRDSEMERNEDTLSVEEDEE